MTAFDKAYLKALDQAAAGDYREITVGGSPHRKVTPRIVSPTAVSRFKHLVGVCMIPGCPKIAGHNSGIHDRRYP
jgi:hypothetical protein